MEAGYYWVRSEWGGAWTVAHFNGNDSYGWSFTGNDTPLDTAEMFGPRSDDRATYELGPRIEEPGGRR